jgi:hypothetical protein
VNQKGRVNLCLTWVDSDSETQSLDGFKRDYCNRLKQGDIWTSTSNYVVKVASEMEMVHGFFFLVNMFDPAFITGFNDY